MGLEGPVLWLLYVKDLFNLTGAGADVLPVARRGMWDFCDTYGSARRPGLPEIYHGQSLRTHTDQSSSLEIRCWRKWPFCLGRESRRNWIVTILSTNDYWHRTVCSHSARHGLLRARSLKLFAKAKKLHPQVLQRGGRQSKFQSPTMEYNGKWESRTIQHRGRRLCVHQVAI